MEGGEGDVFTQKEKMILENTSMDTKDEVVAIFLRSLKTKLGRKKNQEKKKITLVESLCMLM